MTGGRFFVIYAMIFLGEEAGGKLRDDYVYYGGRRVRFGFTLLSLSAHRAAILAVPRSTAVTLRRSQRHICRGFVAIFLPAVCFFCAVE